MTLVVLSGYFTHGKHSVPLHCAVLIDDQGRTMATSHVKNDRDVAINEVEKLAAICGWTITNL